MDKTGLGNRMKKNYEDIYRSYLPRKQYFCARIDGRAFHSLCRNLEKPFDDGFIEDMQGTALALAKEIQGAQFIFQQSDEISIVFTDLQDVGSQIWFDGNIQKIVSVSASIATAEFNKLRFVRAEKGSYPVEESYKYYNHSENGEDFKLAQFDSRVFSISQRHEVLNYLWWRQKDMEKNSVQMLARAHFSHKELQGKNGGELQDMLMLQKWINWNDIETHKKRGTAIYKIEKDITTDDGDIVKRGVWKIDREIPIFSKDWEWFNGKII